jgi:acetyl esterase/lipase
MTMPVHACHFPEKRLSSTRLHASIQVVLRSTQLRASACTHCFYTVQALITLSTPFDIASLQTHFRERGMPKDMLNGIFCPETTPGSETPSFTRTSPYEQVKASSSDLKSYLPPVLLLHGQKDKTVPYSEATQMCEALRSQGVEATCKLYKDETHTTPLLEGPFAGKQDFAMHDVLDLILGSKAASLRRPSIEPWPLLPFPNIATCLATFVCPF